MSQREQASGLDAASSVARQRKSRILIVPFRARHMRELNPDATDKDMALALKAQETGPAYTAFLYGRPVAAAGVSVQKGVGEAWTFISPIFKTFPLTLHREVKKRIQAVSERIPKIYALCEDDGRWLKSLGFVEAEPPEGCKEIPTGAKIYVLSS